MEASAYLSKLGDFIGDWFGDPGPNLATIFFPEGIDVMIGLGDLLPASLDRAPADPSKESSKPILKCVFGWSFFPYGLNLRIGIDF